MFPLIHFAISHDYKKILLEAILEDVTYRNKERRNSSYIYDNLWKYLIIKQETKNVDIAWMWT